MFVHSIIMVTHSACCHGNLDVCCHSDILNISFVENTPEMYLRKGEGRPGEPAIGNQVEAAITSSFLVLIGIFFPSVTGVSACLFVRCVYMLVL